MSATDFVELSARAAADAIAAGSLSSGELFDAYRARAGADRAAGEAGLNCFTWVADRRAAGGSGRTAAGRAAGGQGSVLHRGRAQPVGIAHPRGLRAAVHGHRRLAPERSRREPSREDQPGRVRDGLLKRELRLRRCAQPMGPGAGAGRLLRWQRRGGCRRPGALGARHRHRAARSASRPPYAGSSG